MVAALSLLVGLAAAYLLFAAILQTPTPKMGLLALAAMIALTAAAGSYVLSSLWLFPRLRMIPHGTRRLAVCLILPGLFLPALYRTPPFPLSPLLRPWSQISVKFDVAASNTADAVLSRRAVILQSDDASFFTHDFQPVGPWESSGGNTVLPAGKSGSLEWSGPISQTATLNIAPPSMSGDMVITWDDAATTVPLQPGSPMVQLTRTFAVPWGYDLGIFIAIYLIGVLLCLVIAVALAGRLPPLANLDTSRNLGRLAIAIAILLGIWTVKVQLSTLPVPGGLAFLADEQLPRHMDVMQGQAKDPWQYRVFSEGVVAALIQLWQLASVPQAYIPAFLSLRLLQNAAILLLAFFLYKQATGSQTLGLLGMLLLGAVMTTVFYDSDLSFNTYFDLIFYLLATILLIRRQYIALIPVALFSALNRETGAFIPFMIVAAIVANRDSLRINAAAFLLCAAIFAAIFLGLRLLIPNRPPFYPYHQTPGIQLLIYNVTRQVTWANLFATLGVIPLVGLAAYDSWPRLWQLLLLLLVPAWFVIHFFLAVVAETRLFLVPLAIILLPGALFQLKALLLVPEPFSAASAS